jgi:hypothetical protein
MNTYKKRLSTFLILSTLIAGTTLHNYDFHAEKKSPWNEEKGNRTMLVIDKTSEGKYCIEPWYRPPHDSLSTREIYYNYDDNPETVEEYRLLKARIDSKTWKLEKVLRTPKKPGVIRINGIEQDMFDYEQRNINKKYAKEKELFQPEYK